MARQKNLKRPKLSSNNTDDMADSQSPTGGQTPDVPVSQSTPIHAAHAPAVPSPLNPEAKRAPGKAPAREQREKKESLKKRESNANARGETPDIKGKATKDGTVPSPMRFNLNPPTAQQYEAPKDYAWLSHEPTPFVTPDGEVELKKPMDQYADKANSKKLAKKQQYANIAGSAQNTKGFRYNHCVADPLFLHKQYYRASEVAPYSPHMSIEDSDRLIHFDESCEYITNEKGWRTSRANVFAREGSLYYEVKVIRGVKVDSIPAPPSGEPTPQPHIRAGWARREAPNDAPIGFDGYSYGIADNRLNTMHRSRPGRIFIPQPKKSASKKRKADEVNAQEVPEQHLREGDVLGLLITLPSISLQKKVLEGIYNPAVDVTDGFEDPAPAHMTDIIRDRIPVAYRGNMYFESFEYGATKPMESYSDRSPLTSINAPKPHPNHEEPALRSLPGSSIRVWLNGKEVGTAFEGLLGFLPPASSTGQSFAPSRKDLDDGSLGYYPAVSAFAGGIAQVNLGPNWWCVPEGPTFAPTSPNATSNPATGDDATIAGPAGAEATEEDAAELQREKEAEAKRAPRAVGDRYKEQIAEDVLWDIIDEADFFTQDGGFSYVPDGDSTVKGAMGRAPGGLQDG